MACCTATILALIAVTSLRVRLVLCCAAAVPPKTSARKRVLPKRILMLLSPGGRGDRRGGDEDRSSRPGRARVAGLVVCYRAREGIEWAHARKTTSQAHRRASCTSLPPSCSRGPAARDPIGPPCKPSAKP